MSYAGFLVKAGGTEISNKYIDEEGYKCTPEQRQDEDSYRDAGIGTLNRNVLPHMPSKVEIAFVEGMNNQELAELMDCFTGNFSIAKERKGTYTFFNPLNDSYLSEEMYMPDPQVQINHIDKETNTVYYNSFTIKLIGY